MKVMDAFKNWSIHIVVTRIMQHVTYRPIQNKKLKLYVHLVTVAFTPIVPGRLEGNLIIFAQFCLGQNVPIIIQCLKYTA